MPDPKSKRLKRELGLFDVYAIATGATLSSGFFLLPGLAAVGAGPALPLSYLIAGLLLFPGMLSMAELSTAMPKAGGIYYFLDRSMGPLMGSIGGFGTWISLTLKSAFALIGVGAYLRLYLPDLPMIPLATSFAVLFGLVNLMGAKKTGSFQVVLVIGLLALLIAFTVLGLGQVDPANFVGMFDQSGMSIISTAGLVIVSYMGLTKIASVAEEVKNPERNLPLGMFLAFATAMLVYSVGTAVMVGVVSAPTLAQDGGDLTPVATVAEVLIGPWGAILMTVAALLAFSSVANAGILSASRYPLAMSRDNILPKFFSRVGKRGTPNNAIYVTVAMILFFVIVLDPTKIAKLAGAFQLMMFALSCLAVLVMRESRIASYDPGYRSPFYPWLQVFGILAPFWLIVQMGWLPTVFTFGLITLGAVWYAYYARERVDREGAILHVFERLGRQRDLGLDRELRQIMKEKGLRDADPFEKVVAHAAVIDAPEGAGFQRVIWEASAHLAEECSTSAKNLAEGFLRGTVVGMTPVSRGVALPHLRLPGLDSARMVLVRASQGIEMDVEVEGGGDHDEGPITAVFFLVSPEGNPGQHLRMLAQIAGRVDQDDFAQAWNSARDDQELKEALLRDERVLALSLVEGSEAAKRMGGRPLRDLDLPEGTLVALVRRDTEILVPRGSTVLKHGDRLTIIGEPEGLEKIRDSYGVV